MAIVPVAGSFDVTDNVVTFTPTDDLPNNKVITVTLKAAALGVDGILGTNVEVLADDVVTTFTTIIA